MKIFLLNPIMKDNTPTLRVGRCQGKIMVGFWPNIEYGFMASLLKSAGFDVGFLDANRDGLSYRRMIETVSSFQPDVVFILGITASLSDDLSISQDLSATLPGTRFVYWGTHASVHPEDYVVNECCLVIRKEPELAALKLCQALNGGARRFDDIEGVSYLDQGTLQNSPEQNFADDIDDLPMPDHMEIGTNQCLATDTRRPFGLIKTSRGCPHRCMFCTVHAFHGAKWRPRSPELILEEMKWLFKRFGITDFFFQSDLFDKDRNWTEKLCEMILEADLPISWFSNSRVDKVDPDLLGLMKQSGCRLLAFGVESGSDAVLEAIGKGARKEDAEKTLRATRQTKIPSLTYWVYGLPGETEATLLETRQFIKDTSADYAHFYSPTPLPGSRLYEHYDIRSQVESGDLNWREFMQGISSRFISGNVSVGQINHEIQMAYLRFYSNPKRLVREARNIRDLGNLLAKLNTLSTMIRNYAIK